MWFDDIGGRVLKNTEEEDFFMSQITEAYRYKGDIYELIKFGIRIYAIPRECFHKLKQGLHGDVPSEREILNYYGRRPDGIMNTSRGSLWIYNSMEEIDPLYG